MSIQALKEALNEVISDEALRRDFIASWPLVESILEAFARATGLPIFAFIDKYHVFQSSQETMPPFCRLMLADPLLSKRCAQDGARRATLRGPDSGPDHCCHAGLVNSRRQVDTSCGPILSILFGSQLSRESESSGRLVDTITSVHKTNPALADNLRTAADLTRSLSAEAAANLANGKNAVLMDAIANTVERMLAQTIGLHSLSINLAHEVSLVLLQMASLSEEMRYLIDEMEGIIGSEIGELQRQYSLHAQLGLYVVRNFLSHASEARYAEVTRPRLQKLNLAQMIKEMVDIHRPLAEKKGVTFDVGAIDDLPPIKGIEMEIRRLLYNVLSNAIKYSYQSIDNAQRTIRISSKIPYDPGFAERRFAVAIANYGLGLDKDERPRALHPGFRGRQARFAVPVGAGIGLSEASKIMRLHKGTVKITSTELHVASSGDLTYLTTVNLIFPYTEEAA